MSMQSSPALPLPVTIPALMAAGLQVTALGVAPAAGGRSLGILRTACTVAGQTLTVDTLGTAVATAGAAFTPDAALMADGTGKLIPYVASGSNVCCAKSLDTAVNVGDRVEVFLIPN